MGSVCYLGDYASPSSDSPVFFRPQLRLEYDPNDPNTFRPGHENIGYLKLRVRNDGRGMAHNCHAELQVIIPPGGNRAGYPSTDIKVLVWGREADLADLRETAHIRPHHTDMLHVVFAHPGFPHIQIIDAPQRFASVSIMDRIRRNGLAVHDSFTIGPCDVVITVYSNETSVSGYFRIIVDNNHLNLNMDVLPNPPSRRDRMYNWFRVQNNPLRLPNR